MQGIDGVSPSLRPPGFCGAATQPTRDRVRQAGAGGVLQDGDAGEAGGRDASLQREALQAAPVGWHGELPRAAIVGAIIPAHALLEPIRGSHG